MHKLCGMYTANATGSEGGDTICLGINSIISFFVMDLLSSSCKGRQITLNPKPLNQDRAQARKAPSRAPKGLEIRLMDKILHGPKDPKLWELWYIPYYGSCRIYNYSTLIDPL